MNPADRTWEFLRWNGEWIGISAMSATVIVLKSGEGFSWRRCAPPTCPDKRSWRECADCTRAGAWLPSTTVQVRYSVPIRDPEGSLVPMPWRKGYLDGLAQDMGHPEVTDRIRNAQAAARQERATR